MNTLSPAKIILIALLLVSPDLSYAQEGISSAMPSNDASGRPKRPNASEAGVVRINTTVQPFDFYRPWNKKQPSHMRGIGAVVEGGRVLVSAALVANRTYIEVEKADDAVKCEALVEVVDYEANLALIKPLEGGFLDGIPPLSVSKKVNVGDALEVLQLESGGTLARSPGRVTSIELALYPATENPFLTFKLSVPLQYREGSHSLPVVDANGALAGIMLRYDARSQLLEIIPAPVVSHFIADATNPPYEGFPRSGIRILPLRDPVLRRYLKGPPGDLGVYVESLLPGSTASKAGIQPGDILLKVGSYPIDADGNFLHPTFGELGVAHIFSTEFFVGDEIPIQILRHGQEMRFKITAASRPAISLSIPPHSFDKPPPYLVVGGIVLTELSRAYLIEWGDRWETNAPLTLVHLDRYQDTLIEPDSRVVIISQILPTDDTVGYEEIRNARVLTINGRKPKSLKDASVALNNTSDGFQRIEIDTEPGLIVLDASKLRKIDETIARTYGISSLRRLD